MLRSRFPFSLFLLFTALPAPARAQNGGRGPAYSQDGSVYAVFTASASGSGFAVYDKSGKKLLGSGGHLSVYSVAFSGNDRYCGVRMAEVRRTCHAALYDLSAGIKVWDKSYPCGDPPMLTVYDDGGASLDWFKRKRLIRPDGREEDPFQGIDLKLISSEAGVLAAPIRSKNGTYCAVNAAVLDGSGAIVAKFFRFYDLKAGRTWRWDYDAKEDLGDFGISDDGTVEFRYQGGRVNLDRKGNPAGVRP